MKKSGKLYRKSRDSDELQADIPLGKLLLGLTHLSENLCLPPEKSKPQTSSKFRIHTEAQILHCCRRYAALSGAFSLLTSVQTCDKLVHVNLSKSGVERPTTGNGLCEMILWSQLENQNPLNSHISKLFKKHIPHNDPSVVTFKKSNSIEVKFTIHRTYFSIGIDTDLLSSKNFFTDVFNLIKYRGGKVRVRVRLAPELPTLFLGLLSSGDHNFMLVPMAQYLVEFSDFVRSLWVIVLKESSSSDLTTRSSSDFSNIEDLSLWKVWNWRLNGYYPNYDAFNDDDLDMYQNDMYSYEMQDADAIMEDNATPYDVDMDPDGDEYMGNLRASCIYPKEFIMALRDHPLSRKKPENIEHINIMVKSYNGYQMPQSVEPVMEEEIRKYSKKFLLSLRYAPLSLRRPDCPEHSSGPNLRMQCFKQAREAAAYRHYEKDPLSPAWFPPFTPRRDYDRLHCAMHYKRY